MTTKIRRFLKYAALANKKTNKKQPLPLPIRLPKQLKQFKQLKKPILPISSKHTDDKIIVLEQKLKLALEKENLLFQSQVQDIRQIKQLKQKISKLESNLSSIQKLNQTVSSLKYQFDKHISKKKQVEQIENHILKLEQKYISLKLKYPEEKLIQIKQRIDKLKATIKPQHELFPDLKQLKSIHSMKSISLPRLKFPNLVPLSQKEPDLPEF